MARYSLRGNAKLFLVPTLSDPAAPTATEVNAGTDLSKAVTTINNLEFNSTRITEPVLSDTFSPQIDGGDARVGDRVRGAARVQLPRAGHPRRQRCVVV